jgi:hypothetical protein
MTTIKHNRQVGTKGLLNKINEKYGTNQKRRTVPIQDLIKYHKPKQQAELIALIESHTKDGRLSNCACGCKSAGKIEDFADNLYDAYIKYSTTVVESVEYKDWEDCYIFMKHLFVINSLKGNLMENKVLKLIQDLIKQYNYNLTVELASSYSDFKYSIDLSVYDSKNEEVFGIQVKPLTYLNFHKDHTVVRQNVQKNKAYGKPVVYVYYDCNSKVQHQPLVKQYLELFDIKDKKMSKQM